jgi:hypothetical protein
MGLLDKMEKLENEAEQKQSMPQDTIQAESTASTEDKEAKPTTKDIVKSSVTGKQADKKKVPQLKVGAGKKMKTKITKKPISNEKLKNLGSTIKKPDALANARKTSKSSLHTHLNKTDQHGVSHKDRIEEELQAQVKKIKKIMVISVGALIGLILAIWLIVKIIGLFSSEPTKPAHRITYYQLKVQAVQFAHSKSFDREKFDKVFNKFVQQASATDKKKAVQLKARLLRERNISK